MQHSTWQGLSQLPVHYLEAKAAPEASQTAAVTPRTAHPGPSSTASVPAAAPTTRGLSVRVDAPKTHLNSEWATKFTSSEKEIKDLKLDATRPKICLSYHLRGTCFESCREHPTHLALTAAEKVSLQAFLEKSL